MFQNLGHLNIYYLEVSKKSNFLQVDKKLGVPSDFMQNLVKQKYKNIHLFTNIQSKNDYIFLFEGFV